MRACERSGSLHRLGVLTLAVALASCVESPTEAPTVDAVIQFAKGGNGPSVNAAEPAMAEQEVTLDVRVLGSGFDRGSNARWLRGGAPAEDVVTNSTTYVSGSELIANITIALSAAVDLYDIEVTTRKGKKGVGVELFAVQEKGTGGPPGADVTPILITMSGGMIATDQDGQHGTDAPDLFQLSGQPHGPGSGCEDPTNPNCFWSALALETGYLAAGGLSQCTVPRRMSNANRDRLLSKLDSPLQARQTFDLEYDRDARWARLRTFWYEADDPTVRYAYFLDSNDVVETGGPGQPDWQIVFTNGELQMYGLGDKALICDWQDSITLTLRPPSG